jgi:pimeloyl-ACP methyl ester carboxylesterase
MRARRSLSYPREIRPIFVGIVWPSVLFPDSEPPRMEAGSNSSSDAWIARERREIEELGADLRAADREEFYRLIQEPVLNSEQARELARILTPIYEGADPEFESNARASESEVLALWSEAAESRPGAASAAASLPDPRDLIRYASVWQMKDRAGVVGRQGVGPLLRDGLAASDQARVHLIGHSYGCKVLLSALCFTTQPRNVESVLLLQPAVSARCFSPVAGGAGKPGGYVPAVDRVNQPIICTFSKNDSALHQYYHLALRRERDLGERDFAPGQPSRYAALGGYGPQGCGDRARTIMAKNAPDRYAAVEPPVRIVGLESDAVISDHGDVSNEAMWWALYWQVSAP